MSGRELMHVALTTLLNRMDSPALADSNVIKWGAPVPSFGDLSSSSVATVGLNPSNREFVNDSGQELCDNERRFHTLRSLGLNSWPDVDSRHLHLIVQSCRMYFRNNPYDRWFKRLDQIVCGTTASFYSELYPACHLDLIPYATAIKWMDLDQRERAMLLDATADALGLLLRDSPVRIIILNGKTVVEQFQYISGAVLVRKEMPAWSLPRESGRHVGGFSYRGKIDHVADVRLNREVIVLGYNHNIQSSFGVTSEAIAAIRDWVAEESCGALR
jgi:hypothetical protein